MNSCWLQVTAISILGNILILNLQLVLIQPFVYTDERFNMFPVSVDHVGDIVRVCSKTNLVDASGGDGLLAGVES